jgi:uncharacterized protein (DUF1778 family)
MASTTAPRRSDNINIRVTPDTLGLIDRAAQMVGRTRTDFILDTVSKAAADALFDHRLFALSQEQWEAFTVALDAPPAANPALATLLGRRPAWEK